MDERSFRNAKLRHAFLIAYKASADLAAKGSLFVVTVVAARRLSPQDFGVFSLGSTLGWMAAVASDFGIQLHVARAVARRPEEASALLSAWLRVRWATASGALVAAGAGAALAPSTRAYAVPIALFALVYVCSGLVEFLHYFYRGLSRSDVESTLTLWQRAGTLGCGVLALLWRPSVSVLAIAMLAPVVLTLAASLRIARSFARASAPASERSTAGGMSRAMPAAPAPIMVAQAVRREIWPIGAGIVLSAVYFRVDVFLVQLWSGTEAVGLYNAAFRLVDALRLFPAAVIAVVLPSLCRAADLRPLARAAAPVTLSAAAVAAVLWMAADVLIPALYHERYAAAIPAFRILLLAFPLMSLNMALTHQLVGWDGQRAYAALCAAALTFNLAVNARLIPAWSIDGAAWTTVGTELFLTAGCAVALWTTHGRVRRRAGVAPGPLPESVAAGSS
ncbi:MAG TPA: oligosaccharide flippase family protein [Vicinamibacterales bacterium]|nr:oligosaccharide flippase family protein [Vicinamibacterales bacterium]